MYVLGPELVKGPGEDEERSPEVVRTCSEEERAQADQLLPPEDEERGADEAYDRPPYEPPE